MFIKLYGSEDFSVWQGNSNVSLDQEYIINVDSIIFISSYYNNLYRMVLADGSGIILDKETLDDLENQLNA